MRKICEIQNYSPDIYEEALNKLDFLNYQNFENINYTYSNSIQKTMWVIGLVARRIKQNSQNWFDGESDKILKNKL